MVLDVEQARRTRKIKEALHIAEQGSERPLMNKDNGWYISNIWRCLVICPSGECLNELSLYR